jgi:hypothetical protein
VTATTGEGGEYFVKVICGITSFWELVKHIAIES